MIKEKFIPRIIKSDNKIQNKLEVIFDLREIKESRWEIIQRMNYNRRDSIQRYLIEVEGFDLSSDQGKTGIEDRFFTHEINPGNYYYDKDRQLLLTKFWMQPLLNVLVYGQENLEREKLIKVKRLEEYLLTGK